jgi:hypothetical protein
MSGFQGLRPLVPAHLALEPVVVVAEPEAPSEAPVALAEPLLAVSHLSPPERLQAALKALRWTYGTLAVALRTSASTTRNWGLGRSPVPVSLLVWLEDVAAYHVAHPAPPVKG